MALVDEIKTFQICGYQNSGKTTMITSLIQELARRNVQGAVLKHHGHGGKLTIRESQKDSERHLSSGAVASLVAGEGNLQLLAQRPELSLKIQLSILSCLQPDIILIEGYKYERFRKAVIIKEEQQVHLLDELQNICAIIYWPHLEKIMNQKKHNCEKIFLLTDPHLFKEIADIMMGN